MASVDTANNPNDPTNPNNPQGPQGQQPGQGTNQPATTGGAGAVTSTGASNVTGQVVGTNNPAQPFQNISSYLAANAPQSADLASQVAGTVQAPINQASEGIKNAADTFTKSVNTGYTPENKDLTSAVASSPSFVVNENPENAANFKAQLNDKYTGPSDFTTAPGYSDLQAQIANAQGAAANTKSEAGIQTLLKGIEGPTTAGINKLDSLLLNMDPNNLKTIQNAGEGAANLTPTLNSTTATLNDLASKGSTEATTAAANAKAALQQALDAQAKGLNVEQKTIEDLVNKYNASVAAINPATQKIAQAIQDFLRANPNIKGGSANDPFAAWENLQNISMPSQSTYASSSDYATIDALAKLGIDPSVLSGLPINSSTANQAQTFQLPTQLRDALGKSPEIQKSLQDELSGFGDQINTAVAPFAKAQQDADQGRATFTSIVGNADIYGQINKNQILTDPKTGQPVPPKISGPVGVGVGGAPIMGDVPNPRWAELRDQANAAVQQANAGDKAKGDLAGGLQWVNGSSSSLQQLIDAINGDFRSLGDVGAPTLSYGPNAPAPVTQGTPIGVKAAQDFSKAANTGAAAAAAATGIGSGIAEAGAADLAAGAVPGAVGIGGPGATIGAGLQGFTSTLGPAALAAYGGSNIAQNVAANPINTGLMTLANMGLSLATLSLPPQILSSIGDKLGDVINDIGDFFGGLF